jgi:hypothetical protein
MSRPQEGQVRLRRFHSSVFFCTPAIAIHTPTPVETSSAAIWGVIPFSPILFF